MSGISSSVLAAEQSLSEERQACAQITGLLKQEREARGSVESKRLQEVAIAEGTICALEEKVELLEEALAAETDARCQLLAEREAAVADREGIAAESSQLVEKLEAMEERAEQLELENEDMRAAWETARMSRDALCNHCTNLLKERNRLLGQVAMHEETIHMLGTPEGRRRARLLQQQHHHQHAVVTPKAAAPKRLTYHSPMSPKLVAASPRPAPAQKWTAVYPVSDLDDDDGGASESVRTESCCGAGQQEGDTCTADITLESLRALAQLDGERGSKEPRVAPSFKGAFSGQVGGGEPPGDGKIGRRAREETGRERDLALAPDSIKMSRGRVERPKSPSLKPAVSVLVTTPVAKRESSPPETMSPGKASQVDWTERAALRGKKTGGKTSRAKHATGASELDGLLAPNASQAEEVEQKVQVQVPTSLLPDLVAGLTLTEGPPVYVERRLTFSAPEDEAPHVGTTVEDQSAVQAPATPSLREATSTSHARVARAASPRREGLSTHGHRDSGADAGGSIVFKNVDTAGTNMWSANVSTVKKRVSTPVSSRRVTAGHSQEQPVRASAVEGVGSRSRGVGATAGPEDSYPRKRVVRAVQPVAAQGTEVHSEVTPVKSASAKRSLERELSNVSSVVSSTPGLKRLNGLASPQLKARVWR
eukprot:jgi/Mesen1/1401/ME000130S00485